MSALGGRIRTSGQLYWVCLLIGLLAGGCSERVGDPEGQSGDPPLTEGKESFVTVAERIIAGEGEDSDWQHALSENPRGLYEAISEIDEADEKRAWMLNDYFYRLSKVDPFLARDLLPEELSQREQAHRLPFIAQGMIEAGDVQGAAELLNTRYRGEGLANAIRNSMGAASFDDNIAFWKALKDGQPKVEAIRSLAERASGESPETATEWYENLDDHLKPYAATQIANAFTNVSEVTRQLALTNDALLRERLANGYGKYLCWEVPDPVDAAARLATLPEELIAVAEVAFIDRFVTGEGGNVADVDSVRAYLTETITQEGRDLAHRIIASDEFSREPERGIAMLIETGLHEKDHERWQIYMSQWLKIDGIAASEYIAKLPPSPSQQIAVEATVKYMRDIGDQEAAQAWRELLIPEENTE